MASSKPKVLVDINIFVDVFQKRQGWNNSLAIIEKIRGKEIQGYISALTVPILYFQRLRISR